MVLKLIMLAQSIPDLRVLKDDIVLVMPLAVENPEGSKMRMREQSLREIERAPHFGLFNVIY